MPFIPNAPVNSSRFTPDTDTHLFTNNDGTTGADTSSIPHGSKVYVDGSPGIWEGNKSEWDSNKQLPNKGRGLDNYVSSAPDTRSIGEIMNEGDASGINDTRTAALFTRGGVEGVTSVATGIPDLANYGINWFRKHVMETPESEINRTSLNDITNDLLDKAGFPKPENVGEKALTMTGSLIGGTLAGAAVPSPKVFKDSTGDTGAASAWNSWGNANGGHNIRVINNLVSRDMGVVDGADRLTPEIVDQALTDVKSKLDYFRSPKQLYLYDPKQMASEIEQINNKWTPKTGGVSNHDVAEQVQNIFNSGRVNGDDLGQLSTNLGKAMRAASNKSEYNTAMGLGELQDHIESIIKTGLGPQEIQIYDKALQQYKTIQGVLTGNNLVGGNIQPASYAAYIGRVDPLGLKAGQNGSQTYQVLRKIQEQLGVPDSALKNTMPLNQAVSAMKALGRVGPGLAQQALKQGLPTALRAAASQPGFFSALGEELAKGDDNDVDVRALSK